MFCKLWGIVVAQSRPGPIPECSNNQLLCDGRRYEPHLGRPQFGSGGRHALDRRSQGGRDAWQLRSGDTSIRYYRTVGILRRLRAKAHAGETDIVLLH